MIPWKSRITPYEAQRSAIWNPPENAVIIAAPKTGKTIGCLQWLIEQTEQGQPHQRFLWVSPVFRQSQIAFRRAYTQLLDMEQIGVHKTDYTITMPNDTVIFFGSGDKADNIYGEDYWAVVVEEATRTSLEAWVAITSTTQHTGARIRLIGNNIRRGNWAKKIAIEAKRGALPEFVYAELKADDAIAANVIDRQQFERTKRWIPADEWQILYGNEDVDDGGISIATHKLTQAPVPDVVLRARGWDLASTEGGDWTVGVRIAASSVGYWIEDMVRERFDAVGVLDLIKRTAHSDGPTVEQVIEQELGASGPILIDAIRRELWQVSNAGPVYEAPVEVSKQVRAWPFVAQVGLGRYHFAPGFTDAELIAEFEQWPDSRHDDIVDAISHAHNHVAPMVEGMIGSSWRPGLDAAV